MKTLVSYVYFETPQSLANLEYFAQAGMVPNSDTTYVVVVNGRRCSVPLPDRPDRIVLPRDNVGFDFGGHRHALAHLAQVCGCQVPDLPFEHFVFLNGSVAGPFLPAYFPAERHWSSVFTSRLNQRVKLIGPSIFCPPATDLGGYGPKVEGYCFATDRVGLGILWQDGGVFCDHRSKTDAIVDGEYGMSRAILRAGYTLDCLLCKYQGIDWSDPSNWNQNGNVPPSRQGSYEGISIHPFEVVFHKWYWSHHPQNLVSYEFVEKYRLWKTQEIHRTRHTVGDPPGA